MRLLFCSFGGGAHEQNCEMWLHSDKTRVSKGYHFGTQPLEQRCSVVYLLPRLTGKMRVSHDRHTHFIRQQSGQVFANGNEQKACLLSEVAAGISARIQVEKNNLYFYKLPYIAVRNIAAFKFITVNFFYLPNRGVLTQSLLGNIQYGHEFFIANEVD